MILWLRKCLTLGRELFGPLSAIVFANAPEKNIFQEIEKSVADFSFSRLGFSLDAGVGSQR